MEMPQLDIQYICKHTTIKPLPNTNEFKEKPIVAECNNCYCDFDNKNFCNTHCQNHTQQITYQRGFCKDCPDKFVIRTQKEICDGNGSSSDVSVLTKCYHPSIALHIIKNTMKPTTDYLTNYGLRRNEGWVNASGNCLLCDSRVHAKRKCTGVIIDNKNVQLWDDWILT